MAGPAPSKEILKGALTEVRRASEVAKQSPTLANSLMGAAVAALAPLAAGNAAVGQALSAAWSSFHEALWNEEEDAEKEQRQAEDRGQEERAGGQAQAVARGHSRPENASYMLMPAGPRTAMNRHGRMQKISGMRILMATF